MNRISNPCHYRCDKGLGLNELPEAGIRANSAAIPFGEPRPRSLSPVNGGIQITGLSPIDAQVLICSQPRHEFMPRSVRHATIVMAASRIAGREGSAGSTSDLEPGLSANLAFLSVLLGEISGHFDDLVRRMPTRSPQKPLDFLRGNHRGTRSILDQSSRSIWVSRPASLAESRPGEHHS